MLDYDGDNEFERGRLQGELSAPRERVVYRDRVIYRDAPVDRRKDPHRSTPEDAGTGHPNTCGIPSAAANFGRAPGVAPSRVIGGNRNPPPNVDEIPERPRKAPPEAIAVAGILVCLGAALLAVVLFLV